MSASSITSVNGNAAQEAHVIAFGATASLALVSTTDVKNFLFSIIAGSAATGASPTINVTGFGLATLTMVADPGGGVGRSFLLQTVVNAGLPNQSISTRLLGAPGSTGVLPICPGETTERSPALGWVGIINQLLGL